MASANKIISVPRNPVCNTCNTQAKIYYAGKWWCSLSSGMGNFNVKGYCKHGKKGGGKEGDNG